MKVYVLMANYQADWIKVVAVYSNEGKALLAAQEYEKRYPYEFIEIIERVLNEEY